MNMDTKTLRLENSKNNPPLNASELRNQKLHSQRMQPKINSIEKPVQKRTNPWGIFVLASTFVLMLAATYLFFYLDNDFAQFREERLSSIWGFYFVVLAVILFIFKAGFFGFTLFRYFKYRSISSVSDEELPMCTVIVPAYNEGKQVYDTLMSLANSDYPEAKLQLLSIDDGSQDDTWYWMQQARKILGERLDIYQQPQNKGKRHALYRGFNLGTGDVFVTVDSDSIVKADTLRNLVSPFIVDENCGAVAGNIRVLNNKRALLPKMLDVSFVLSFEFVRSAESSLDSVLCTPGALAAYRRKAVFACLPEWINQSFMGKASDIDARISVFEHLCDVYQQSNQLHAALQMKDSLFSAQDSLNQMKNGRLFEANRVKFEIRNYQKQLSDNQQKLAAERSFFYTLISIAVLVIALITWALRNSYIKNKQRKIIHKRSEEIMELELEKEKSDKLLLENRLKKKETLALLEQEKLKNEIESKNRKLTVKALHLSSNNQFIETIMQSLSEMTEASRNVDIKNLEKQLKLHLKSGSEWDEFFTHFEEVNQGFISSLREKHPDLTSNDIRFLSYVFMNLTTKEIASLFNITPEACRKRKERISKKMNLIDNTDLYSYLSAI